jgi:hypothetical protein
MGAICFSPPILETISSKTDGIYKTTRNGEGLTEIPFDLTAQAAFDNATAASDTRLSVDACNALCILVNEKMEDFD